MGGRTRDVLTRLDCERGERADVDAARKERSRKPAAGDDEQQATGGETAEEEEGCLEMEEDE